MNRRPNKKSGAPNHKSSSFQPLKGPRTNSDAQERTAAASGLTGQLTKPTPEYDSSLPSTSNSFPEYGNFGIPGLENVELTKQSADGKFVFDYGLPSRKYIFPPEQAERKPVAAAAKSRPQAQKRYRPKNTPALKGFAGSKSGSNPPSASTSSSQAQQQRSTCKPAALGVGSQSPSDMSEPIQRADHDPTSSELNVPQQSTVDHQDQSCLTEPQTAISMEELTALCLKLSKLTGNPLKVPIQPKRGGKNTHGSFKPVDNANYERGSDNPMEPKSTIRGRKKTRGSSKPLDNANFERGSDDPIELPKSTHRSRKKTRGSKIPVDKTNFEGGSDDRIELPKSTKRYRKKTRGSPSPIGNSNFERESGHPMNPPKSKKRVEKKTREISHPVGNDTVARSSFQHQSSPGNSHPLNPKNTKPQREPFCSYCQTNGEMPDIFTSHNLYEDGELACPVRIHGCKFCGATGDESHTSRQCPERAAYEHQP